MKKVLRWVAGRFCAAGRYVADHSKQFIIGAVAGGAALSAQVSEAVAPVDFGAVGTEVSGWAGEAATAGVVILTLIVGIAVMKKVFKTTAS